MLPSSYSVPVFHAASTSSILKNEPDMLVANFTSSNRKNSGSGPTRTVSAIPVERIYSSARFAIERGSRS
ncbi:Uncharacterised protein [Vibrio cholerae]|nr:Uncharacterised protein [Vibrio cholerae]